MVSATSHRCIHTLQGSNFEVAGYVNWKGCFRFTANGRNKFRSYYTTYRGCCVDEIRKQVRFSSCAQFAYAKPSHVPYFNRCKSRLYRGLAKWRNRYTWKEEWRTRFISGRVRIKCPRSSSGMKPMAIHIDKWTLTSEHWWSPLHPTLVRIRNICLKYLS